MNYSIAGAGVGLLLWLIMLESPGMGGVLIRTDENGNRIFTPNNIPEYIKSPFKHAFFWKPEFLIHNWIVMTSIGAAGGYTLSNLVPIIL